MCLSKCSNQKTNQTNGEAAATQTATPLITCLDTHTRCVVSSCMTYKFALFLSHGKMKKIKYHTVGTIPKSNIKLIIPMI